MDNKENSKELEITPLVRSLSRVIMLPANFNIREQYADYLIKKYQ